MSMIFANESRPDLAEAIRTDYTAEYLFPIVFPAINVYEDAGQISVATSIDANADVNRTYSSDLTINHYGNTPVSFTTSAYESRVAVSDSDLKLKGDDLSIILPEMANEAAEAALGGVEVAAEAALYAAATTSVNLTSGAPLKGIAEAAYTVAPYGEPTLVCSQYFLTQLLQYEGFTAPILKLFGEGVITGLIAGSDAVLKSVGGWMGLPGGIKVGKDSLGWKNAGRPGNAYVVALRPEMRDPARAYWTAKAKPSLGATLTFVPRDTEGRAWYADTTYLPGPKLNCVDVGVKNAVKVFCPGAIAKIALPA